MLYEDLSPEFLHRAPGARARKVVDGIVVDQREIWFVVARDREDLAELLDPDHPGARDPLTICRAVREDGSLELGPSRPSRVELLSEMIGGDRGDQD